MGVSIREPLRIAYYSDAPWIGGAERYLYLLAANLPRNEFAPCLVVDDASRLASLGSWMRSAGVPVHEIALGRRGGAGAFVRALRKLEISILHCNMPGPWGSKYGFVAPLAKLAGSRAVVSTEHLPMVPPFAKGSIFKTVAGAFIDRVITVSDDNVRWLRELHRVPGRKIRVVHIGIPEPRSWDGGAARRALGLGENDFICLLAASLEERKGHRFALDAIARLPERVKLLIAGSGAEEGACRHRSSELGITGRVHFLGHREDVPALIAACDALVVPSLLEATPFVIVEAMALGRPVVASRIYGIPELVMDGETGMLVDPGSGDALAGAIGALEGDRSLAARLGAAGRRGYERAFRIERCVADTVAVYRELIPAG